MSRVPCRQRADVVLSWLFYREDRAAVAEYVDRVPVFTGGYQFYLRADGAETVHLNGSMFASLLWPLHTHVWLTLGELNAGDDVIVQRMVRRVSFPWMYSDESTRKS